MHTDTKHESASQIVYNGPIERITFDRAGYHNNDYPMADRDETSNSPSYAEEVGAALDEVAQLVYVFTAGGDFRYWNDAVSEVTGYSDDEIETMGPADFFIANDRMHIQEAITRALDDEYVRIEATLQTTDGDHLPYEFSASSFTEDATSLVAGVGRSISERKEYEEQRQLYEYAYNSALTGIALGTLEGQIRTVNPMFLDMWGYDDEEEVLGKSITEFWKHADEAAKAAQTVQETGHWQGQLRAVRNNGTEFHAQCTVSIVTDETGDPLSMMASFVDISDRVKRERELQKQNEQLEEFASVVSHDLRNPLTVATGRLQLAQDDYESEHLDLAIEALERMEAIIEDTLVLAQEGQTVAEQEWIQMQPLGSECWEMVDTTDDRLEIAEPFEIYGDRGLLQHVLENLFRNAVEHGEGASTVRVGPLDAAGFYVEDDGPGIPEDKRKTVLEPGYTTESDGTGFGLAIVNRIAQAHGWDIRVADGTDEGARFEFTNVDTRCPAETINR
jgi:PAS domain S-box-containing protein